MKTTNAGVPSIFKRLAIYFTEMFPVLVYIPFVIAQYFCLNFTVQSLSAYKVIYIDIYGIVGIITAFLMMLLIRTFDDLKDIKLDKELYPERPIPRGDVLVKDIKVISIITFLVLVATNLFFAKETLIVFGIMIVYALLSFKWFFTEKLHKKYVLLTMITHQPIPYVIIFFLIHTALASGEVYEKFNINYFLVLLIFGIPISAWEISRKIKSVDKETAYITFSSLLGPRGAAVLPISLIVITSFLASYIGNILHLPLSFLIVIILLTIFALIVFINFILQPTNKNNILKTVSMIYSALLFINIFVHIVIGFSVKFNLI